MTFETDLAAAEASGLPFRRTFDLSTGVKGIVYLTAEEIADNDAAQATEQAAQAAREAAAAEVDNFDKRLKAVAIWTAQKLGIPLAQAKSEIRAIIQTL